MAPERAYVQHTGKRKVAELNPRSDASEAKPGPCPCSWTSTPPTCRSRSFGVSDGVCRMVAASMYVALTGWTRSAGAATMVTAWSRAMESRRVSESVLAGRP